MPRGFILVLFWRTATAIILCCVQFSVEQLTSKTLEVTKLLSLCRNLKLLIDCKTHICLYANRYIFVGHLILNWQIVFSLILFLNAEGKENSLKNALLFFMCYWFLETSTCLFFVLLTLCVEIGILTFSCLSPFLTPKADQNFKLAKTTIKLK